MTKSQTVERGVKRWLFRKTNNPEDLKKVMDEYRTTGKLRLTLRQRLNVWVHRMVMAPGTRETFYPASDEDADLGSVSWFLTHCETGEIISQAESVPMLSQTQIELSSSGITGETQSKTILLSDRYKLELHDSRTESVKEGFALNAKDQLDPMSFGWEWFLVDASGHSTKLQETGELELTFANPAEKINIIGCKFLTDTSLRFSSHEYWKNRPAMPYEPQYRLTVKAGSHIYLPVLVDGVVRMPTSKV